MVKVLSESEEKQFFNNIFNGKSGYEHAFCVLVECGRSGRWVGNCQYLDNWFVAVCLGSDIFLFYVCHCCLEQTTVKSGHRT